MHAPRTEASGISGPNAEHRGGHRAQARAVADASILEGMRIISGYSYAVIQPRAANKFDQHIPVPEFLPSVHQRRARSIDTRRCTLHQQKRRGPVWGLRGRNGRGVEGEDKGFRVATVGGPGKTSHPRPVARQLEAHRRRGESHSSMTARCIPSPTRAAAPASAPTHHARPPRAVSTFLFVRSWRSEFENARLMYCQRSSYLPVGGEREREVEMGGRRPRTQRGSA